MNTQHGVHSNVEIEFKLLCDNWDCDKWEYDVYGHDEQKVIDAGLEKGWLITGNLCLCPDCKEKYRILSDLKVGSIIAFRNGDRIVITDQTELETKIEMLHKLDMYENVENTLRNTIKLEDLGRIEGLENLEE